MKKTLFFITLVSTYFFTPVAFAYDSASHVNCNNLSYNNQSSVKVGKTKSWIIQDITNDNHLMRADRTTDEHGITKTTYTPLVYDNNFSAKMAAYKIEEEKIKNGQ